ncbi:LOW QUALITY PROTEIN: Hypothetical protein PHPALM_3901 [Phytophthora palmivora]|uniref:Uncharacterized protein n=1 Tax=Phytophthora palmivora TaxID=4796 RepID=A0A2P4YL70_9STRA|nr:LOW QUALITY PROTEIN: Hypothetical protein PHPALM_3901 [Phytophthora palmivora]
MDGEMDVDTENAVDSGLRDDRADSNPEEEEDEVNPPDVDDAVAEHIDSVLGCCQNECLSKLSEGVPAFISGYMTMSKDGQRTSLVTALAVSAGLTVVGQRHHLTGQCVRYAHCIPFVEEQNLCAIPQHGNTGNRNAKFVDEVPLKRFLPDLAEVHGGIVPVRFRHQKTKDQ